MIDITLGDIPDDIALLIPAATLDELLSRN